VYDAWQCTCAQTLANLLLNMHCAASKLRSSAGHRVVLRTCTVQYCTAALLGLHKALDHNFGRPLWLVVAWLALFASHVVAVCCLLRLHAYGASWTCI
jgi:hypothetical protein